MGWRDKMRNPLRVFKLGSDSAGYFYLLFDERLSFVRCARFVDLCVVDYSNELLP